MKKKGKGKKVIKVVMESYEKPGLDAWSVTHDALSSCSATLVAGILEGGREKGRFKERESGDSAKANDSKSSSVSGRLSL